MYFLIQIQYVTIILYILYITNLPVTMIRIKGIRN